MMTLRVFSSVRFLVDEPVSKVTVETPEGAYTLLPRHIDAVLTVVPSILSFVNKNGDEEFVALDDGILVKQGTRVFVASIKGVRSQDLGSLEIILKDEIYTLSEREKKSRTALAILEANILRKFQTQVRELHE
ncbi:F0F1 ATP synthase subunit epsilon [candidate division KSB1 bacterium]|nr:F0F1 ATP synthase subunit epsilon [candidate division KSB1 bacterium]